MQKNYDCCYLQMPKEDNKTLKYNHGEIPWKFHSLFKNEHTPSG